MELMVQMRPNTRLLNQVRAATGPGGTEMLQAEIPMDRLIPSPELNRPKADI